MVSIPDTVNADCRDIFERYLTDFSYVEIHSTSRVVNPEDDARLERDEIFYIFESAIPDGYDGGGWNNITQYTVNEGPFFKDDSEKRVITCTSTPDILKTLLGDDGLTYISCNYKNILMLNCGLDQISREGLESIFNAFEITATPPLERVWRKFKKISVSQNSEEIKKLERDISTKEKIMKETFEKYKRTSNEKVETMKKLVGAKNFIGENFESEMLNRFERIYKSEYVDGFEFDGNIITIITKPIYVEIWNIGIFKIEYVLGTQEPKVTRLEPPITNSTAITMGDSGMVSRDSMSHSHTNISGGMCMGNAQEILTTFWRGDYLTSINFMIQFLRSYGSNDPYTSFENLLAELGYIKDAHILKSGHKVNKIENGVIKDFDGCIMDEAYLRALGCTGVMDGPEVRMEYIERLPARARKIAYDNRVAFVPAGRDMEVNASRGRDCDWCGERIREGEGVSVNGERICQSCAEDYTFECNNCGELSHVDYRYTYGGEAWCERCHEEYLCVCNRCGETTQRRDATLYRTNGEWYCNPCMEVVIAGRRESAEEESSTTAGDAPTTESTPERVATPSSRVTVLRG